MAHGKSRKLAWVLRLYPRAWRNRYEEEFLALLEQYPATLLTLPDMLLGALDAHLYPQIGTGRMLTMTTKLRTAAISILWAWVGFVIVGMGFQKLSEDAPFKAAAQAHPTVGIAFDLIVIGAAASALAMAAGGLPIGYKALITALTERRWSILLLFALPVVAFAVAVSGTLILRRIPAPAPESALAGPRALLMGTFLTLWIGAAVASATAGGLVVARSEIGERLFTLALRWGVVITLAMAVVTVAVAAWGLGLREYVPMLYAGNGGLMRSSTWGSWIRIVVMMALLTLLATAALVRGWRNRTA